MKLTFQLKKDETIVKEIEFSEFGSEVMTEQIAKIVDPTIVDPSAIQTYVEKALGIVSRGTVPSRPLPSWALTRDAEDLPGDVSDNEA